jgi:hypothetical protein
MSDHITVDGKKYFEESYLQLANSNTKRAREEIEQWKTWGIIEIAVRNPNVASYMDHWEGRALRAEEENAELKGIIAGLQDVAAGRVRPFVDIQNELESK